MKTPSKKEKLEMYESFLHDLNMYIVCGRPDLIGRLVGNADNWSYAHRAGNGELSEKQQQKLIDKCFYKLRDVETLD